MKHGNLLILALALASCTQKTDVLVVGGGASGTAAALQAARMGAKTLIVEETPWLGGMLTSAGVSAIDGNYRLRGGIFGEFTDSLASRYGGYDKLQTGWVSNILFEPRVGEEVLEEMAAAQKKLSIRRSTRFTSVRKTMKGWEVKFDKGPAVRCKVLIDGTELGDIAKACGVKYHIGFDPRSYTGEEMAPEQGNDIVQDMTFVVTLKDYGPDADMTIPRPENYDSLRYVNCCLNPLNTPVFEKGQTLWSPAMMLSYGALPGGELMINWPIEGNDFYANIIDLDPEQREAVIDSAKRHTLGFLYFLQTTLGYRNLGPADDEYPSEDGLALIPYYRESRRIEGEHLFTLDEAKQRYGTNAFRSAVAVGDYPVDHHHFANPAWKNLAHLSFSPIPSFSTPAGVLVPLEVEDLIVAEKSVSVSCLINGATRLQPVVMELGQAAGALAVLSLRGNCPVREVSVRALQKELLSSGAYLQPWLDLKPGQEGFEAIQRIGCTGILRGVGRNVDWNNESWLRVGDDLLWDELYLDEYYGIEHNPSKAAVTVKEFEALISTLSGKPFRMAGLRADVSLSRLDAAIVLDSVLNPFEREIDWNGELR